MKPSPSSSLTAGMRSLPRMIVPYDVGALRTSTRSSARWKFVRSWSETPCTAGGARQCTSRRRAASRRTDTRDHMRLPNARQRKLAARRGHARLVFIPVVPRLVDLVPERRQDMVKRLESVLMRLVRRVECELFFRCCGQSVSKTPGEHRHRSIELTHRAWWGRKGGFRLPRSGPREAQIRSDG
jgi:hypothetical protein